MCLSWIIGKHQSPKNIRFFDSLKFSASINCTKLKGNLNSSCGLLERLSETYFTTDISRHFNKQQLAGCIKVVSPRNMTRVTYHSFALPCRSKASVFARRSRNAIENKLSEQLVRTFH